MGVATRHVARDACMGIDMSATSGMRLLLALQSLTTAHKMGRIIMSDECNHTGMYELLEAIEAAIESAEPAKRDALKQTINDYMEDFPDEYFWAIGPQSPTLLHHIMYAIEPSSRAA